jgi:ElaB/YqjD/DUF883 family membrane-anchored ribosome-binding protein
MGQSPEELKQDVESTRAELSDTLDAIGDRVSPGRMIERRKNRMRQGMDTVRERIMGVSHDTAGSAKEKLSSTMDTVRDLPDVGRQQTQGHPLVAGALAFGVGFLVAAVIPRTEAEEQMAPQLADTVEPLKQQVTQAGQQVAQQLKEPAQQAATELKETAKEGAQEVAQQAKEGAGQTASAGRQAADELTTGPGSRSGVPTSG